jgi:hypothetical protein
MKTCNNKYELQKNCMICNELFRLKTYPSGRKETPGRFYSRKCCSKQCGAILSKKIIIETRSKSKEEIFKNRQNRSKKYYERDKEKILNIQKERWKNDSNFRKRRSNYVTERKKNDINFKLNVTIRNRVNKSIIKKYKTGKSIEMLGASIDVVRKHIEDLWLTGMSWENHKKDGWHIDHIIPLSSCNNEEDMVKLCHYKNLQPLWAEDNLKKSDKMM